MSKRRLIAVAAVIVVALVLFVTRVDTTTYAQDTVLEGDQSIGSRQRVVLDGGATLTINGNLDLRGELACGSGGLNLVVNGDLTLSGDIRCASGGTIAVAVAGSVDTTKGSLVETDGSFILADSSERLAADIRDHDAIFANVAVDSGPGPRLGPLADVTTAVAPASGFDLIDYSYRRDEVARHSSWLGATAHAADGSHVTWRGRFVVRTPPPGVKQIVLLDTPGVETMNLTDLNLTGPDGRAGESDVNNSCDAKGKDGEDAFRLMARAPNLRINNVTLNLGNGGTGGDAETIKDCKPGTAKAGKGGAAGNFKLLGVQSFTIEGEFIINPGAGGDGGFATAKGKDGGASEDGGDATATGGAGAENRKRLSVQGTVGGVANVQVGMLLGGRGGDADALPGTGGDGIGCGAVGGKGGKATATAAKGGDAKADIGGGATRTPGAQDEGGDGGDATATGAKGGNGGSCDSTGPGGNGGAGGDTVASAGKGGNATVAGEDGEIKDQTGGNGGNGGDGCGPGKGAKGGSGDPAGTDGTDGKNLCIEEKKSPTPQTDPGRTETPKASPTVSLDADLTFSHVKPGEYSEVYATVRTVPGGQVTAVLAGPGVELPNASAKANADGVAKLTWTIYSYGTYTATVFAGVNTVTATVNVK